jgi:hypothetical protein
MQTGLDEPEICIFYSRCFYGLTLSVASNNGVTMENIANEI